MVEARIEALLPSFAPFATTPATGEKPLFRFEAVSAFTIGNADNESPCLLEEDNNDMGHLSLWRVGEDFEVETHFEEASRRHRMRMTADFSRAEAVMDWQDRRLREALSSLLRVLFSVAVVAHKGCSIHASVVVCEDEGFLFLGASGTGKSTHARLWCNEFGAELLNDDNPMLRIEHGEVVVYGTPWSGKTLCYKNKRVSVGAIVRLRQALENHFQSLRALDAFMALLPGISAIRQYAPHYETVCDTLGEVAQQTKIGLLACRPDGEAARCCRMGLMEMDK